MRADVKAIGVAGCIVDVTAPVEIARHARRPAAARPLPVRPPPVRPLPAALRPLPVACPPAACCPPVRRFVATRRLSARCLLPVRPPPALGVVATRRHLDGAPAHGHIPSMLIYKILRAPEWEAFEAASVTSGAPIDLADGFIHFSTAAQVAETAAKYFAGVEGLMLVAVETDRLGTDLRWEPARAGALFPHLYRDLDATDIAWTHPLPLGPDGAHVFPAVMT